MRRDVFLKVDAFVREHNQAYADGTETFTVGHNQFSTWTKAEFDQMLGLKMPPVDEDLEEIDQLEGVEESLIKDAPK